MRPFAPTTSPVVVEVNDDADADADADAGIDRAVQQE